MPQCLICLGYLQDSIMDVRPPCGHKIHMMCYESLKKKSETYRKKCPLCKQSYFEEEEKEALEANDSSEDPRLEDFF